MVLVDVVVAVVVVGLFVDSVTADSVVVSDMEFETETALLSGLSLVKYKNANTIKAIMTITRSMLSTITGAFDFPEIFSTSF